MYPTITVDHGSELFPVNCYLLKYNPMYQMTPDPTHIYFYIFLYMMLANIKSSMIPSTEYVQLVPVSDKICSSNSVCIVLLKYTFLIMFRVQLPLLTTELYQ